MTDELVNPERRHFLRATAFGALAAGIGTSLPASALAQSHHTANPIARVRSGRIVGRVEQGTLVFLGIPYGADTATRRFRPALEELPWHGVREAFHYGPSAPQIGELGPGSEDCLYLNVWTPALHDGGKRPILVYIHGGGYDVGTGSDALYDGGNLSRRGNVVVITLNHRLNLFGYLYLGYSYPAEFADSGNVGQLDQIQALKWVRQHAAEFGGDADNVTLFGQSGGGGKIATLMSMPAASGLFHKAWTMSGEAITASGPRVANQRAQMVLKHFGVNAESLSRMPMKKLLEATAIRDPTPLENTHLYFGPVLDGRGLPRNPFYPDAPPQSAGVPMVIGNTHDETRFFLSHDPANFELDWTTLIKKLHQHLYVDIPTAQVIAAYRRMYPRYTPSEVFFAATTAARGWRGAVEELQARARQGAPTWAYTLDWYNHEGPAARLRAFHGLDLPLVFHNVRESLTGNGVGIRHLADVLHLPLVFQNIRKPGSLTGDGVGALHMADVMSDSLLALAHNGEPGHPGLPSWDPYTLPRRQTLVFDTTSRLVDDPRGGERKLFTETPLIQSGTV